MSAATHNILAINNVEDMANHLRSFTQPGRCTEFVLSGGAALFLHGLRTHVRDIDAFSPDESVYLRWLECGDHKVDITANPYMWGQVKIQDYHKSAEVFRDKSLVIRLLNMETLFIQKADAARENDIEDCKQLARVIQEPLAIAKRMGELRHGNEYGIWCRSAQNLLAEIQAQYLVVPDSEMIMATRMEMDDQIETAYGFGFELEHAHKRTAKA